MLRVGKINPPQIRQIPNLAQRKELTTDSQEVKELFKNNVIPLKKIYPSIGEIKRKLLHINDGWKDLSPSFNAHLKVFPINGNSSDLWIFLWTKRDGEVSELDKKYKPIPKNSILYHCFSGNCKERKFLEEIEKILCNSFAFAKEFTEKDCGNSNFLISVVGEKGYGMCVTGANSIEIAYPNIDSVLECLKDNDEENLSHLKNYFKGAFAHEMTHQMRGELEVLVNTGQEIASHAIELLACGGDNPFADRKFELAIGEQDSSYHKDMVASLKVVQQLLTLSKKCLYKPKNCKINELNKAMKSISEKERVSVLKQIALEVINLSNIELLRIAAGIGCRGTNSRGPN